MGSRGNLSFSSNLLVGKEPIITGMMLFNNTEDKISEHIEFLRNGLLAGWVKPVM